MNYSERDHGYGDSPSVDGSPRILKKLDHECDNCGCPEMFMIEVTLVEDPYDRRLALLQGEGKPTGTYIGCPACPYASPMMTTRKR